MDIIEYETIDLSNVEHIRILTEMWNDKQMKEYYYIKAQYKNFNEFLKSFNSTSVQFEKLVKINNICVGWVETCKDGKRMEFNCFILKKYRSLGFCRTILDDLTHKNPSFDIIAKIKKSNYAALQCIKSFPFNIESKSDDGKITYKLTRNS
jgi:hypothetical protein